MSLTLLKSSPYVLGRVPDSAAGCPSADSVKTSSELNVFFFHFRPISGGVWQTLEIRS